MYFHAIVSRDFAFNPDNHRVCVRGGDGLGKTGWTDACEMNYTKDLQELGSLVEGSMVIPRESLDKPIPYKYIIHRGGSSSKDTAEYEFIYEQPRKKGEHVNRSLLVESALLDTGGEPSRCPSGSAQLPGSLGEQAWGSGPLLGTGPAFCLDAE